MGSRQPERSIPDVRDVFQRGPAKSGPQRIGAEVKGSSHHNNNNQSLSGNNNQSFPKTLTEKDMKHIERHLSMKKTIRKQLSRHLSKAFVEADAKHPATSAQETPEAAEVGVANTLPAPPTRQLSSSSSCSSSRNGSSNLESATEPTKKSNFWKKLTIRSRSKR